MCFADHAFPVCFYERLRFDAYNMKKPYNLVELYFLGIYRITNNADLGYFLKKEGYIQSRS